MAGFSTRLCLWLGLLQCSIALRYDAVHEGYNLNENKTATLPKDYWGEWDNHTYQRSPENWRFPFYVLTIDRFIDGDPSNNDANGTNFEHHWMANQFRFGGDAAGIFDNLDYIQGLGIKAIYFTGSMMLNMPWSPDGYGPLDFTLLDRHHGSIQDWRKLSDEIHHRGMYFILDSTMSTMANLLGYAGDLLNATVEFSFDEYDAVWKEPERRYHDFDMGNDRDPACQLPRFWEQNGFLAPNNITDQFHGCRDSDFDMFGDIKSTGAYPSYINQLSRFASVQDRLREWKPDVLEKINVMACMQIAMLDIDGYRMDKATQITLDAQAAFSDYQRKCARKFGKENFLVVGEIVSDPRLAATYVGRGKQPDQELKVPFDALSTSNTSDPDNFIRSFGHSALDAAAFHYDVYGSLTRFLGLDGPWGSLGVDWVQMWNRMLATQDLVNANTGLFDPRHMFGTTNQDVFRWPALANGIERQLLGLFVTTLELPGIPMVFFGEEQEHYVLESLAPDYTFGRAPFASSAAWQLHGCYGLGIELYVDMPFNKSTYGCLDDSVSLDHRDPSHRTRSILKRMFELREQYPVLNDGYNLTTLSTHLHNIYLPGSQGMPSPHGVWSVHRGRAEGIQDLNGTSHGNQPIHFVFHNENTTVTYDFNCDSTNTTSKTGALLSTFPSNTTIKNLFYPYEEYVLENSKFGTPIRSQGCLGKVTLRPWEFKAFVPREQWEQPKPVITDINPRHDTRILSAVGDDATQSVKFDIGFSSPMDCKSVSGKVSIQSTTQLGQSASVNKSSIVCAKVEPRVVNLVGQVPTTWMFSATLDNVANGVHTITVDNATDINGKLSTLTRDKFMFRIGRSDNPMIFPKSANYTQGLLQKDASTGGLFVIPKSTGADKVRYSTNWGSSYSDWQTYTGGRINVEKQSWSGTKQQRWDGEHIILEYWSRMTGSSQHVQHSDLERIDQPPRRWPHAWIEGDWNQWGYDSGIANKMQQDSDGKWSFGLFTEWPTNVMVNVWGMNPDGVPDKTAAYGDVDRDGVLDWIPPDSLAKNVVNISASPIGGHIGFKIVVDDGNYSYKLVPSGSAAIQGALALLLCFIPLITAIASVYFFRAAFYKVKVNKFGAIPNASRNNVHLLSNWSFADLRSAVTSRANSPTDGLFNSSTSRNASMVEIGGAMAPFGQATNALPPVLESSGRRTVLIATMEYEIEDWAIKIKIGGLGVMSSLMANNLGHQDLIWVIPCVGDVEYPFERESEEEAIHVTVMDELYNISVYRHTVRNITFIILDAPIFRQRTKADPYPPRMDDLESAIYYSIWNQCIAEAIKCFRPDLYHINDYHGACAPLYLLPDVIPCALSLHNAEFQGMWPLGSSKQLAEMCRVFNLDETIVKRYLQFGDVFNLLHAAARYLQIHQEGFGAVGVSKKYGKRSLARYPIFWSLQNIGSLPNPDPGDLGPWDKNAALPEAVIDVAEEAKRPTTREEAQRWAGLDINGNAELFVFVGRWSEQKGVDLIADVFSDVLKSHQNTQLLCVGPVIDLHGRFAALKFEKLMEEYPGRVCSKPQFTALPSCVFRGAEFALMPSRDEPFGLVAVEFGRQGALCIGSRVGGFGNMPGWWFTVEAMTSKHLISQFKAAISSALATDQQTRAVMRAHSVLQRFPVVQWIEDLEILQQGVIDKSFMTRTKVPVPWKRHGKSKSSVSSGVATPRSTGILTPGRVLMAGGRALTPRPSIGSLTTHFQEPRLGSSASSRNFQSPELPYNHERAHSVANSVNGTFMGSRRSSRDFDIDSRPQTPKPLNLNVLLADQNKSVLHSNATPTFTDANNQYLDKFTEKLATKRASQQPNIQEYIVASEKDWFKKFHAASLVHNQPEQPSRRESDQDVYDEYTEIFNESYDAPQGIGRILQKKVGSWCIYSYLLALGQILSASSLQLTLLTGAVGQPAVKLYTLCSIYIIASIFWWCLYRKAKSVFVLSTPFAFFGLSFLLLGFAITSKNPFTIGWIYNVATGLYTFGSAAGCFYFALNFGSEGGTPPQLWALRACVISGTQQLLIAFLWYWGANLADGRTKSAPSAPSSVILTAITIPLALLMWAIGSVLFLGLPNFYRRELKRIPSFYSSLTRKGVVLWFILMVILQSYWLTTTYGRNWTFLWSSQHAPRWSIACLVIFFFVFVWGTALWILSRLTKRHSWLIPILAVGLGAPAWCQMLWGVSGIGHYIPWGGPVGGALISRAIWLWLGVLYALQNVGFGMILMATLTRVHIACVLIVAQMVGAAITMLARRTAPNGTGAGEVWVNVVAQSLDTPWFWVCLLCQLVICVGYMKFFRKAQLMKP